MSRLRTKTATFVISAALMATIFSIPAISFAANEDYSNVNDRKEPQRLELKSGTTTTDNSAVMTTEVTELKAVQVKNTVDKVKLTWSVHKQEQYDGFQILRKKGGAKPIPIKTIRATDKNSYSYIDICRFIPKKTYVYYVKVYKIKSTGAVHTPFDKCENAEVKVQISESKRIKAKAKSNGIKVQWSKVKNASGYVLYRYSKKKKRYRKIKCLRGNNNVRYLDTHYIAKKRFTYKVRTYNTINGKNYLSAMSRKASARTVSKKNYYNPTRARSIIKKAKSRLRCAYVSGGSGPRAFDCSGLVYWTLKHTKGNKVKPVKSSGSGMYASTLKKYRVSGRIKDAKKGDVIMFSNSGSTAGICHTGIYAGHGRVIHASTPATGVCIGQIKYLQKVVAVCRLP